MLCHSDADIISGALVARHLGRLPIAISASSCKKHQLDKWVRFARSRQQKKAGVSSRVATSAERELLIESGAVITGRIRLLKIQVVYIFSHLFSHSMSVLHALDMIL